MQQPISPVNLACAHGHERGHLLVARLDELGIAVGPVERPEEPVDAVPRVAEDAVDPPLPEALEHEVGYLRHATPPER